MRPLVLVCECAGVSVSVYLYAVHFIFSRQWVLPVADYA